MLERASVSSLTPKTSLLVKQGGGVSHSLLSRMSVVSVCWNRIHLCSKLVTKLAFCHKWRCFQHVCAPGYYEDLHLCSFPAPEIEILSFSLRLLSLWLATIILPTTSHNNTNCFHPIHIAIGCCTTTLFTQCALQLTCPALPKYQFSSVLQYFLWNLLWSVKKCHNLHNCCNSWYFYMLLWNS